MKRTLLFLGIFLAAIAASVPAQAVKVYFNNPNGWSSVKAYFYKGSANNEWPGAAMTKAAGDEYYSIDVPEAYLGGNVIFSGDGSQYPAATGLKLSTTESMICAQDKDDDSKTIWNQYYGEAFEVLFDNSTENWTTPYFYSWGVKGQNANWPGAAMTLKEGKIWKATLPAGTAGVIFNNGAASGTLQSGNFAAAPDHKYNKTTDLGADVPVGDPFVVYFDNTSTKWTQPKVHFFGGATESAWPGENMIVAEGKVWKYTVAAGTTGVVFNDGNGNQSDDLVAVANHVYTKDGGDGGVYTPGQTVDPTAPANVYILGTVGDTFWATTPGVAMTKSGSTYTAENVEIKASAPGAEFGYFTLVSAIGADWDAVNNANRYGAAAEDAVLTDGVAADVTLYEKDVNASAAKSWKITPGKYTVVFDFSTMKVTATKTGSGPVAGTGSLEIPDVTIQPAKDATMEIQIKTQKPMTALQLDIELPEVVGAGAPLISRTMGNHTLMSNVVNGKLRIVVFSATNSTFSADNGALLYLPLTAAANAAVGDYEIKLTNIVFSDADLLAVPVEDITGKLTVEAVATGSITLDKTVLAMAPSTTAQLTATVLPEDAAVKTVTWSSDNAAVATVSQTGLVSANANGTAVITASCNGLSATCTVYVGKSAQTITWNDAPTTLGVGESVDLVATAPGGDVVFTVTSGSAFAEITNGNKLTGLGVGVVTVTATQAGNDTYAPAEPISKNITIWLGYIPGDVTGDNDLSLDDVTTTVNHILGKNPTPFNSAAADFNGDGVINVADVTLIVYALLKMHPASPAPKRMAGSIEMEKFNLSTSEFSARVSFTNMSDYVATMFEITLPEGTEVSSASVAGSDHEVAFRKISDNTTRVVVYSLNNSKFHGSGYVDLMLNNPLEGEFSVDNALVNKTIGDNIVEDAAQGVNGTLTGIENIKAEMESGAAVYYNLQGVRVSEPANGVYIRVRGNEATKVLVK